LYLSIYITFESETLQFTDMRPPRWITASFILPSYFFPGAALIVVHGSMLVQLWKIVPALKKRRQWHA
jgi:hypothetical protein